MLYLVEFFVRLLVDLHRRHRLLHVTQDHVEVLIVGLGHTNTPKKYELMMANCTEEGMLMFF